MEIWGFMHKKLFIFNFFLSCSNLQEMYKFVCALPVTWHWYSLIYVYHKIYSIHMRLLESDPVEPKPGLLGLIRNITSPSKMLPSQRCNCRDLKLQWEELPVCMWCCNKRRPKLFTAGEQGKILPSIPWAEKVQFKETFLRQHWIFLQIVSCWKIII